MVWQIHYLSIIYFFSFVKKINKILIHKIIKFELSIQKYQSLWLHRSFPKRFPENYILYSLPFEKNFYLISGHPLILKEVSNNLSKILTLDHSYYHRKELSVSHFLFIIQRYKQHYQPTQYLLSCGSPALLNP